MSAKKDEKSYTINLMVQIISELKLKFKKIIVNMKMKMHIFTSFYFSVQCRVDAIKLKTKLLL